MSDAARRYVRSFDDLGLGDLAAVGGKTASLGELRRLLHDRAVTAPDGFAVTASAYRDALEAAGAWPKLRDLLATLDVDDVSQVAARAAKAREIVYQATDQAWLKAAIGAAYGALANAEGAACDVAVRSSATAEDLPEASFAGQHDSFLHVTGEAAVLEACRRCFASLFTDRAIVYRARNGFDHLKVALSVAVMRMVDADSGASGVAFTLDTETGFADVVFITGAYGLGEAVVQGRVDPDEFYVHKPTYRRGFRAVLKRTLGGKAIRLIRPQAGGSDLRERAVPRRDRARYCLPDADVLDLAGAAIAIEDHYSRVASRRTPMDIEWARNAADGRLYILQARPETVASRRPRGVYEVRTLQAGRAPVLVSGKAVGQGVAAGVARRIVTREDLADFVPGEVLVARTTSPDWLPAMKRASAIVTDRGGRTCHAAIVARELGIPAVVGTGDATARLTAGEAVTVSCANGESGAVYPGRLPYTVSRLQLSDLPPTRTAIMLNLAQPGAAFQAAALPAAGVGLARMEFIIGEMIGVHPMAAAHPDRIGSDRVRRSVVRWGEGEGEGSPAARFVRQLAEGVGSIAAAFYPRPVIVRLSDFKTNEYATLIGGADFEPAEENPMLGFRGAARYAHPRYADGFALECEALRRVREQMGLTNLRIMVPFCRRVEEGRRVLDALASHGLSQGPDGVEVYVMCEIPNNVIQIDAFARLFDGFSIGSNDLTQLVLGVDRDSAEVAFEFDERDAGVREMLRQAVAGARRTGRPAGICGEAPATYPEIASALVTMGIDSISVNPASFPTAVEVVAAAEAAMVPAPAPAPASVAGRMQGPESQAAPATSR